MPKSSGGKSKKKVKVKTKEVIDALALSLFERPARRLVRALEIDISLQKAGMAEHPVIYVARHLLYVLIAGLIAIYIGVSVFFIKIPFITQAIIALIMGLIPLFIFIAMLVKPAAAISSRRNDVESELPFFAAYVATLARAGIPVEVVIERVAKLKIFKALRVEAQRILREIKYFGYDPLSAIEKAVRNHPSVRFRDFLLGYVTTLRTGGDVLHYLEIRTQELFQSKIDELRTLTERMGTFLELYIVLGVIVGTTLLTFFAVSGVLGVVAGPILPVGGGGGLMPYLFNFLILPLLGIFILYTAHATQPKTPVVILRPYVNLMVSIPLAAIVFMLALAISGAYPILYGKVTQYNVMATLVSLTIALMVAILPPWWSYRKELLGTRGITRATANFLRDLAEVRKTGLSPEKSIIQLSLRDYGSLNPVIRKAASALQVGISLERALARAVRGIKVWFPIAVMRFLSDAVMVGGGAPETIEALARYANTLAEIEIELKRRLRAYVLLPYFGAVMISATPIIIIALMLTGAQLTGALAQEKTAAALSETGKLMLPLIGGALINSFIMGLVAGKTSELSIAAGFKHAALLVLISAASMVITMQLLPPVF